MEEPTIPLNEAERMKLLHQLNILDTESEEVYDGITYIASQVCKVPVSTITLIDHNRQWFKSIIGGERRENPRIYSFCAHVIAGKELLEVPDSHEDERFKDNPLVINDPYVRYYAGIPLELKNGLNVGTLCVIDHKPNKLSTEQLKILHFLSLQVTKLLELRLKNSQLNQKQNALNDDLNAAAEIQKSFLPSSALQYHNMQIASVWEPANPIGGDIFNVIKCKEKIIFYMVDVCGHDVPSALVTVSISQFFSQLIHSSFSPKEILIALNEEFPIERFDRFFTIFCLIVDPATGHFEYSSAAHPPGVILKKTGEIQLLDQGGTMIGVCKDIPFDGGEGNLEAGDKVFLYTDGIIESQNKDAELFGSDRFYALLKSHKAKPVSIMVKEIHQALKTFNLHPQDDVSILGFEYKLPLIH